MIKKNLINQLIQIVQELPEQPTSIIYCFSQIEFLSFSGVTSFPSGSITLVFSSCCLNPFLNESKYCFLNLDCSLASSSVKPFSFSFS